MKVECHGQSLYIDEHLKTEFDRIKEKVSEEDRDYFFVVDGKEGSGKSVVALQWACYLDPTFNLERVVFTPEDFKDAIIKAKKGQVVVFDEAFRGLSSRASLTQMNKLLIQLMMECRQKNLIVFIVMPTFFLLEKYVALFRAKGLFHIYENDGKRGFWMFFNTKKKKILYHLGKKNYYSYAQPRSSFKGRFVKNYLIDEQAYREKKTKALQDSFTHKPSERYKDQRNLLLWYLNRKMKVSTTKIAAEMSEFGWKVGQPAIVKAIRRYEIEADMEVGEK